MITPANFATFITNVNTMIGQAYSSTPVEYMQYTSVMPCTSTQLSLAWTGRMPKARAWFGSRQPHEPAPQTYTVVPIPYENTYMIDRFHLDDDQFGVYYRMLPDMALQWKKQPDYEIRDMLENTGVQIGARQNGFDGLTAFNTAHPVDLYDTSKGTYSNDFTGGGQTIGGVLIGGALSPVAFASVIEYQQTLKDEAGERLGITPNVLMIPPTLQVEAQLILKAAFFAPPAWGAYSQISGQVGAADNVLSRMGVEPVVNHQLMTNTRWYSLDTTKAFKPFLWVVREGVTMTPRVSEDDPVVFDTHKFLWGGWDRMCPAWSYSWLYARSGP
jgi:phage major head subunit gpT-like protein